MGHIEAPQPPLVRVLSDPADAAGIDALFRSASESDPKILSAVAKILERVRREGDAALRDFTLKFDKVDLAPGQWRIDPEKLERAWNSLDHSLQQALRLAKKRIQAFHRRQMRRSWTLRDPLGISMTQRWAPLRRIGVYVPGGSAAYPSTVLMNIIPAQIAGVPEIAAVTPPPRSGVANNVTLAALHLCGVKEVYSLGGAQAIAALAYGTATISRVDKVVGPGNAYVAAAKRLLYGQIDIDSIAGPSEILILADETAPASYIAADMLSQAEHSPDAQAIAILIGLPPTEAPRRIEALQTEIARRTAASPRKKIVWASLKNRGAVLCVASRERAVALANQKAPEHLELLVKNPRQLLAKLDCAGSIFVGPSTPEPLGDYAAGPNHVLPTDGSARFASALCVEDFLRVTQILEASPKGFQALSGAVIRLAEAEGLFAHAEAVRARLAGDDSPGAADSARSTAKPRKAASSRAASNPKQKQKIKTQQKPEPKTTSKRAAR